VASISNLKSIWMSSNNMLYKRVIVFMVDRLHNERPSYAGGVHIRQERAWLTGWSVEGRIKRLAYMECSYMSGMWSAPVFELLWRSMANGVHVRRLAI
jgi:hypothetical protein